MNEVIRIIRASLDKIWADLWTAVVCNLLWTLAQFLILPGPPATLALFYYANRAANGEVADLADFWYAFRRHWGVAWRWGLTNLALIGILVGDAYLTGRLNASPSAKIVQGFYLAAIFIWVLLQLFVLSFLYEQEKPALITALRNGAVMLGQNIFFALLLGIFLFLMLLAGVLLFMITFAAGAIFLALAGNYAVINRLEKNRQNMQARP